VGAVFDLPGHEWCTPEDADQHRQDEQEEADVDDALVVVVEGIGGLGAPGDRFGRVVAISSVARPAGIVRSTRPGGDGVVEVGDDGRVDGLRETVGQARLVEAIMDRQPGGEEQDTEDEQACDTEEQLLAVLPPHQPDHATESS
jgi:hypothetical protein